MIVSLTYAITVNFVPYYRIPADLVGESQIGITNTTGSNSDEEKNVQGRDGRAMDGAEVLEIEKLEGRAH
jgi:hypothetical protein